jgi:hypothetical protein
MDGEYGDLYKINQRYLHNLLHIIILKVSDFIRFKNRTIDLKIVPCLFKYNFLSFEK